MEQLALLNNTPINPALPEYLRWPRGSKSEEINLCRVLDSGIWGSMGPFSEQFSAEYSRFCQVKHTLPVINGTVSLEIILRALGIGRGDEVIVPPYTFAASVTSIVSVGAVPVFADIDPETYTLDAAAAEAVITPKTRAVIAVHLGGRPFDVDAVSMLCRRHGLHLIEDAAHAHGSEWKGQRVGSLGTVASFSFQASKNLSCGEGGAITTNDDDLYKALWSIHNNGRSYTEEKRFHYVFDSLGTNARMAEWQAAVLLARMEKIDREIQIRQENAAILDEELSRFPFIKIMKRDSRITRNSLHLYLFKYVPEELKGISRNTFIRALNAENVCLASCGYNEPIYNMRFMHDDSFGKLTGTTFMDPTYRLPENEKAAFIEGAWLYQSSLLGSRKDTMRIVEAVDKIRENADSLLKV